MIDRLRAARREDITFNELWLAARDEMGVAAGELNPRRSSVQDIFKRGNACQRFGVTFAEDVIDESGRPVQGIRLWPVPTSE